MKTVVKKIQLSTGYFVDSDTNTSYQIHIYDDGTSRYVGIDGTVLYPYETVATDTFFKSMFERWLEEGTYVYVD